MTDDLADPGLTVDAVDTPEPVEAPEPVAVEPEPQWAPTSDDWNQLNARIETLASAIPQPQAVEPVQVGLEAYADPVTGDITADGLQRYIDSQIEQGVNGRISAYEPVLNQTVAERGEQVIQQKFADLKTTVGDFDDVLARELAEGYAASLGDPNLAIQKAAQRAHEFAQAQRTAGVEEYKTTLGNIGQAPREPGANSSGVYDETDLSNLPPGTDKYKLLADRWAARNSLPN